MWFQHGHELPPSRAGGEATVRYQENVVAFSGVSPTGGAFVTSSRQIRLVRIKAPTGYRAPEPRRSTSSPLPLPFVAVAVAVAVAETHDPVHPAIFTNTDTTRCGSCCG